MTRPFQGFVRPRPGDDGSRPADHEPRHGNGKPRPGGGDRPLAAPPGFEPVDISEDMHEIEVRKQREMYNSVDRELDMRYVTPERRIRARYGGATWNMYDPFH